jgi:para-nitrobenzyl esterase
MPTIKLRPVFDEHTVSTDPKEGSDVPFLTGLVADESSTMPDFEPSKNESLVDAGKRLFGEDADRLLSLYPEGNDIAAGAAVKQFKRDFAQAGTWLWAAKKLSANPSPVYFYMFRHVMPGPDSARYGAFHCSEIPYVFGTLDKMNRPFTDVDYELSETMVQYWANFIKTGDPNGPGLPSWPALDLDTPKVLDIGESIEAVPLLTEEKLEFFAEQAAKGVQPTLMGD